MSDRRRFLGLMASTGGAAALGGVSFASDSSEVSSSALASDEELAPPNATNQVRIALMQAAAVGADQHENLAAAEQACQQAAASGADILLMPEMWNIGYRGFSSYDEQTVRAWNKQAIDLDGPWLGRLSEVAKELGVAVAATYLQRWPGGPRNTVSLIDRHGEFVLTYAKVHTCDFAFEAACTPGEGWEVAELDTAKGPVQVGAMICFDREFPEAARCLMLAGAELILTPNACLLDDLRIAQFRVRAYENAMVMAMANYATPPLLNGRSLVVDAAGSTLVEAGPEPGIWYADVDLAATRAYRAQTLWGNAWRRPSAYGPLTREVDVEVFRRTDALGRSASATRSASVRIDGSR